MISSIKKHKKKYVVVSAVFFIFLLACWHMSATSAQQSITVKSSAPITRGKIERTLHATGLIKPTEGAEVKTGSRFTGVIEKLHVRLGDTVKKGQLIAELDSREQQEEYNRLTASLEGLKKELRLHEATYPQRIIEAQAQIDIATSQAKYTQTLHDMYKKLRPENAATVMDFSRTEHEHKAAQQTVLLNTTIKNRLEKEYELIKEQLFHNIEEIEAQKNAAAIQLSYAKIVSPIDGTVSNITAQEGETVVAGLQVVDLITVLDLERLELRVYIDENDIGEVSTGQEIRFSVEAYPKTTFSGTIALLHPSPELRNNIVYYRALVRLSSETALMLRPEMTASCNVVVSTKDKALRLPNDAFKWIGSQKFLFKVDSQGNSAPINITTGLEGDKYTEIREGLQEGDLVATDVTLPPTIPTALQEKKHENYE